MSLTLKSLQTEMHSSFSQLSLRIDNLDTNVHERIDNLARTFDAHRKETAYNFRQVDQRFDEVDQRFDAIDKRFDAIDQRFNEINQRFDTFMKDITSTLSPYFFNIDNMLDNHEERIKVLEVKH